MHSVMTPSNRASLTVALVSAAIMSSELLSLAGLRVMAFALTSFAGCLVCSEQVGK
jgi:hypothetical protein